MPQIFSFSPQHRDREREPNREFICLYWLLIVHGDTERDKYREFKSLNIEIAKMDTKITFFEAITLLSVI